MPTDLIVDEGLRDRCRKNPEWAAYAISTLCGHVSSLLAALPLVVNLCPEQISDLQRQWKEMPPGGRLGPLSASPRERPAASALEMIREITGHTFDGADSLPQEKP